MTTCRLAADVGAELNRLNVVNLNYKDRRQNRDCAKKKSSINCYQTVYIYTNM